MTYPTWKDKQTSATRYGAEIVADFREPVYSDVQKD
jgi:hypothetical protein